MEKKESIFKTFIREIILAVIVAVATPFIIANISTTSEPDLLSKEERNKRILATLEQYSTDVNEKKFDAYKYFTPRIDRFYQMFDTSPKKINDYVNGLFYKQFKNPIMHFDESTLVVKEIDNTEYDVLIIMYATYYQVKEKKHYKNYRTKTELKFDGNFRIKYFRQFFD